MQNWKKITQSQFFFDGEFDFLGGEFDFLGGEIDFLEGEFDFLVLMVLLAWVPNLAISFGDFDLVTGDFSPAFLTAAFFWGDLERDLDISVSVSFFLGDLDFGVGDEAFASLLISLAFLLEMCVGEDGLTSLSKSLAFLFRVLVGDFDFSLTTGSSCFSSSVLATLFYFFLCSELLVPSGIMK